MTASARLMIPAAAIVAAFSFAGCDQTSAPTSTAKPEPQTNLSCAEMSKPVQLAKGCPMPRCEELELFAEITMTSRQAGVSFTTMMGAAKGDPVKMIIVEDAYSTPQFMTAEFMSRAIRRSRDDTALACYQVYKK